MDADQDERPPGDLVGFADRESVEAAIAKGDFDGIVMMRAIHIMNRGREHGLDIGGEE